MHTLGGQIDVFGDASVRIYALRYPSSIAEGGSETCRGYQSVTGYLTEHHVVCCTGLAPSIAVGVPVRVNLRVQYFSVPSHFLEIPCTTHCACVILVPSIRGSLNPCAPIAHPKKYSRVVCAARQFRLLRSTGARRRKESA